MYQQIYDPLGNAFLSTAVAAIPILVLLYFIALHPPHERFHKFRANVQRHDVLFAATLFPVLSFLHTLYST